MSERLFQRLIRERAGGKKLFVPFITAGDRGIDFTRQAVLTLAESGADAVELGVPFSDPIADGPVIQRASQRALEQGVSLPDVYRLVREIRQTSEIPIILMGYFNPFLQPNQRRHLLAAASAGVDGLIIPDLPPEEAGDWVGLCREMDLDTIFLATPTSTEERLRQIIKLTTGYVYYVSVTGTTGVRNRLPSDLSQGVNRVRSLTPLPVLVGFGVSSPDQARTVAAISDGVIIGSALIQAYENVQSNTQALSRLREKASAFSQAIKKR